MMPVQQQSQSMYLSQLLSPLVPLAAQDDVEVAGMSLDSRGLGPGFVFVALPGAQQHGLNYLLQAIERGVAAVLWQQDDSAVKNQYLQQLSDAGVPGIAVPNLHAQLGELAARFFSYPARQLRIVGITGTDGKSSVAHLLAQAMELRKQACGLLGTLGKGRINALEDTGYTTPDAIQLQAAYSDFLGHGISNVSMEVSSHALAQGRVDATLFEVAILTHLSRDHFDYHGDLAGYKQAKAKLFQRPELKRVVLNIDDAFGAELAANSEVPVLTYAVDQPDAELRAEQVEVAADGLRFVLRHHANAKPVQSGLIGAFNVANLLAVAGGLLALGWSFNEIAEVLGELHAVPGRMDMVSAKPVPVLLDFAHTPEALTQVLKTLRPLVTGKLYCVFGCGGDRDRGKRPLMAQAVLHGADLGIITDDNPRNEDPQQIVADALVGLEGSTRIVVEHDRRKAIKRAIESAQHGDLVLVAGKGHEEYQLIGGSRLPFSDRTVITELCAEAI